MLRATAIIGLAVLAASLSAQEPVYRDQDFRVSDIQARLLYEQSGTLSVDITDNPNFIAFNSVIGAGDAQENADDLFVTAVVQGPGQHNLSIPLVITARDEQGRVLATRRIDQMLAEGRTHRSILLHGVGCAGVINLTAQLGSSNRSEVITLGCGE